MKSNLLLKLALAAATLSLAACDLPTAGNGSNIPGTPPGTVVAGGTDSLILEPDSGMNAVYALIQGAHHSIDLTMYELQDTTATSLLANAAKRGVAVRVLLDHSFSGTHNDAASAFLQSHGVSVKWAPSLYKITHQKTMTVDGTTSLIMTFNWQTQYYSTTRDVGVVDKDPHDVAAIEATFAADFAATSITPSTADDLVWSPTDAETSLLQVINSAKKTLLVENEEMASTPITNALTAAAQNGVNVEVVMTNSSSWTRDFSELKSAGVHIRVYDPNASLYIHAKVIIADGIAFVGSQNFSTTSLTRNRELGIVLRDTALVSALQAMVAKDYAGATGWS